MWTKTSIAFGVAIVIALGSVGCKKKSKEIDLSKLPKYTLVYGGDFTLGRRINLALYDKRSRSKILAELKPLLKNADIALVNGEGVIAKGGLFADKGEPRPYMYRAHPNIIDVMLDVGIDVVAVGNNHAGDYGPEAYTEMLDRLSSAGIQYVGGGHNIDDAKRPAYVKVGDTVVALVGADLTVAKHYRATADRAGSLFFRRAERGKSERAIVRTMTAILKEARRHAHVVLFTPHWGDNWIAEPTEHIRRLAKRLIRAGFDGILGHSAHWIQGVELIDGKPVIYDAGNILLDYGGGDDAHRCMLWRLTFNKAGVEALEGYPIFNRRNRTLLAKDDVRDGILKMLDERSEALGTKLDISDGVAKLKCAPNGVREPSVKASAPVRPKPERIRLAPGNIVLDSLPKAATPTNVEFENGIRLIGYRLINEEIGVPKGGQMIALYFQTDRKIEESFMIHLEARGKHAKTGREAKALQNHLPGDWVLPTQHWPVGKVIQDWTLFRLLFKPEGEVNFYLGIDRKGLVKLKSSDLATENDELVHLGSSRYKKGAQRLFDALDTYYQKVSVESAQGDR